MSNPLEAFAAVTVAGAGMALQFPHKGCLPFASTALLIFNLESVALVFCLFYGVLGAVTVLGYVSTPSLLQLPLRRIDK